MTGPVLILCRMQQSCQSTPYRAGRTEQQLAALDQECLHVLPSVAATPAR